MAIKKKYDFEKSKTERVADDKRREKDKKFFNFLNKLIILEMILGLLIALIVDTFFYKNLK